MIKKIKLGYLSITIIKSLLFDKLTIQVRYNLKYLERCLCNREQKQLNFIKIDQLISIKVILPQKYLEIIRTIIVIIWSIFN